jgi:hypothetical protein
MALTKYATVAGDGNIQQATFKDAQERAHPGVAIVDADGNQLTEFGGGGAFSAADDTEKKALVDADRHVQVDVLSGGGGAFSAADDTEKKALVDADRHVQVDVLSGGGGGILIASTDGAETGEVYLPCETVDGTLYLRCAIGAGGVLSVSSPAGEYVNGKTYGSYDGGASWAALQLRGDGALAAPLVSEKVLNAVIVSTDTGSYEVEGLKRLAIYTIATGTAGGTVKLQAAPAGSVNYVDLVSRTISADGNYVDTVEAAIDYVRVSLTRTDGTFTVYLIATN